ncbi:MAG: hypothetical protein Q9163_003227 [Psora crenata]
MRFDLRHLKHAALLSFVISGQCHSPSPHRSSLRKREVTFDSSCKPYQVIEQGVLDAAILAQNASAILQIDNTDNPFELGPDPWEAVRLALFGDEQQSPTNLIVAMYDQIASNPDVHVFCGMPTQKTATDEACHDLNDCVLNGYHAFHNFVDPAWADRSHKEHDGYVHETECGFPEGHNVVVCPGSFPGGIYGFSRLNDFEPKAGQSLDCGKQTWGAMFVHELSHVFGTRDHGAKYGFDGARDVQKGIITGATPLTFADTFSLFALDLPMPNLPVGLSDPIVLYGFKGSVKVVWALLVSTGAIDSFGMGDRLMIDKDEYLCEMQHGTNPEQTIVNTNAKQLGIPQVVSFITAVMNGQMVPVDVDVLKIKVVKIYASRGCIWLGIHYPQGLKFKGMLKLWDFEAIMNADLSIKGFRLPTKIKNFQVGPLDVKGARDEEVDAELELTLKNPRSLEESR